MDFDLQKKKYLGKIYKPDNSKKGTVDKQVSKLLDKINKLDDYYTTSSCAGRITLFIQAESDKKCDSGWLSVSHEPVNFKEVMSVLAELPKETVWFRMESSILHISCRDMEAAEKMLMAVKCAGFKHSGIMDCSKRLMLELISSERMDVPISKDKELLVSEDYIKFLIENANKKLKKTREKIKKLEGLLKSLH
ncbi:MAG: tRNA wybutosine-synthesizing 3 family protein [archaeon]